MGIDEIIFTVLASAYVLGGLGVVVLTGAAAVAIVWGVCHIAREFLR
jgi:hypothetical protein